MKAYITKRNNGDVFDVFEDFFKPMFYDEHLDSMRTDIKETEKEYQLEIEMPGFKKEEIKIGLENGYLTVGAEKSASEENQETAKYLRRECRVSCQRSYYVGDKVEEENVRAKYENGMLTLVVPKEEPKKVTARCITIE